jgi:hypothetical protein
MSAALQGRLTGGGIAFEPARRYRVATLEYFAGTSEIFGEPEAFERGDLLLRDALVTHLRAGGLADASA